MVYIFNDNEKDTEVCLFKSSFIPDSLITNTPLTLFTNAEYSCDCITVGAME